jgi:hypothetical protein
LYALRLCSRNRIKSTYLIENIAALCLCEK